MFTLIKFFSFFFFFFLGGGGFVPRYSYFFNSYTSLSIESRIWNEDNGNKAKVAESIAPLVQ